MLNSIRYLYKFDMEGNALLTTLGEYYQMAITTQFTAEAIAILSVISDRNINFILIEYT